MPDLQNILTKDLAFGTQGTSTPRSGCQILRIASEIQRTVPHNGAKSECVDVEGVRLRGGGYAGSLCLPHGGCMQPLGGVDRRDVQHPPS